MTEQVHAAGGRIVLQISHAGVFARQKWTGRPALAVSADAECPGEKLRQEIDGEEIKALTEGFAAAAARARAGGFDGVQIHAGHGYLLNQFLSPLFNQRRDAYGGSIENRGRILVQILRAVREAVGPRYPVLVKLNGSDHEENGLTLEESIAVGRMLKENGLDAVELSGGLLSSSRTSPCRTGIHGPDEEAYFLSDAAAFRESVSIPLILVGGIRSLSTAESIRERKTADYIAMSRPFIREPGLIRRWRDGDTRSSFCNSDNLCFGPGIRGEGIYCVSRYGKGKEG
jgi:2,4-dienoyl-CoA reductase-like NADH-dependent reductase (Old Yellow Enzyme family)